MNLTKKEKNFINFLLNLSTNQREQEIIDDYNELSPPVLNYISRVISEKQYEKHQELIDSLEDKFLIFEIKKDKGTLRSCESLLKCSEYKICDLSLDLDKEDLSETQYIIHLLPALRNDLKDKVLSEKERKKWWGGLLDGCE